MADALIIKVGGQIYKQWKSIEITKDLEAIAGAYNLTLTTPSIFTLVNGAKIDVEIGNKPIISGYIENVSFSGGGDQNEMTLRGRDKTGDLVDCSIVTKSSEYLNMTFKSFCESVCKPFGINVIVRTPKANQLIPKISLEQGSAFEEMEREARKLGVFLFASHSGDLVIAEVGKETINTRLEAPGNIIKYQANLDYSDRFSDYTVKGHQSSSKHLTPQQQIRVSSGAQDHNIERYRPLIVVAGSATTSQQAKALVEYEAAVRAGRSETVTVTVNGWTDKESNIWETNKLILVVLAPLGFEHTLLIKSVVLRYSETGGQITELTLTDPGEFTPKPVIPKKAKGKKNLLPVL